jgi:hypothetical protein
MLRYKIAIEYIGEDETNGEKRSLEPLFVEARSFAEAVTSEPVAEALHRLETQIVDKQVDSLPPEVAVEVAASSNPSYSVQIYAEVEVSHFSQVPIGCH